MFFISLLAISLKLAAINYGPEIQLTENSHDFGQVRVGALAQWFVTIHNAGDETLLVYSIEITDKERFFYENDISFPLKIESADSIQIKLFFKPENDNIFETQAVLSMNDSINEYVAIELVGQGFLSNWAMGQVFWQYQLINSGEKEIKALINTDDINGDETRDLAVASGEGYITCLSTNSSNQADLLWAVQISEGTLFGQNCLVLINDIDSDGYKDIAVGTAETDRSILVLSGKTGSQIWKHQTTNYGLGGAIYQLDVSYDFNGDGYADLLAASGDDENGAGPKRIYCLDVFSGEIIWERPLTGPVYAVIGIDDFTGDGQPDAIAGTSNFSQTEGSAIAINGASGYPVWQTIMPGKTVSALIQVDDTENSGHKNVMIADASGEYRIIDPATLYFIDVGGIGFSPIHRFVLMDDLNNDGHLDVLVSSNKTEVIVLNGAGGSYLMDTQLSGSSYSIARIADVSGDAINDLLIGTAGDESRVYIINGTHGNILFDTISSENITAINSIMDINGDGSMDVVSGDQSGKLVCFSGGLDAVSGMIEDFHRQTVQPEHGSFPNPFSNQTTIYFELKQDSRVIVSVYDPTGRKINTFTDLYLLKGKQLINWDINDNLENGIYYYNICTPGSVITGKMIHIK